MSVGEVSEGYDIRGKVVLVTGAASGIGRAIARAAAAKAAAVVVADVDNAASAETVAQIVECGGVAWAHFVDVRDVSSLERLADGAWERFGKVDVLFNNAGVSYAGQLLDADIAIADWLMQINLLGVFNAALVFGRRFRVASTPSHMCLTGSEHSVCVPHAGAGVYTASKHAVLALAEVLRREAPPHLSISILCPGVVDTNLWDSQRLQSGVASGDDAQSLSRRVMSEGMNASAVASHTLRAIEAGEFYIFPHAHLRRAVLARNEEILGALERQASWTDSGADYDVPSIVERLVATKQGEGE